MEPSYINDWPPLDTSVINTSSINHHINPNNSSKASSNYDNYLQNLLNMQKSAHAELELFRRLVVDGGATSSTPPFNIMMPSSQHYPLSASPLAQLLSTSHFAKPFTPSSPKRSRDSNAIKEEDNKDGEEKGRKVWKKVKSKVKKEELNTEEGRKREEEERGAQVKGGDKKERDGTSKKTSKKEGEHDPSNNTKGAKASSSSPSCIGVLTKASSSHICSAKSHGPCKKEVQLSPPPPPKTDFIHVRARRGQATDSHSLAERVRREKISERMRFLQELVPGCSKITGKAMMLDEIINYVQSLQHQVEFLAMKLADLHPKQIDINSDDTFMEKEIASALAEVQGACPDMVVQAMEQECPSYHMQMHDFPSFLSMRFCDDDDDEDLPFISEVSTNSLI